MPINVVCACGKQLKVKDELAGKKIKCPACQAPLTVAPAEDAEEVFKLADEPAPTKRKQRKEEPPALFDQKEKSKSLNKPSRFMMKLLVLLGGGLVIAMCCAGLGVGAWFWFFNFTGSELVGDWQTDAAAPSDLRFQMRVSRSGNITLAGMGFDGVTWHWRVSKKTDQAYTIDITSPDGKRTLQWTMTLLSEDRLRLQVPRPGGPTREFELVRLK